MIIMVDIEENKKVWNNYDWSQKGNEWSIAFGSTENEWNQAIYPRIKSFLNDVNNLLEIACGMGRWTNYLKNYAHNMVAIDISEKCIEECKKTIEGVAFYLTDGESIPTKRKFDFVFSFDSLVHADKEVLEKYVAELSKKLSDNGVAFIHHSNLADIDKVSYSHFRDKTMSGKLMKEFVEKYGLHLISQEYITWGTETFIDCITIFTKSEKVAPYAQMQNFNRDFFSRGM